MNEHEAESLLAGHLWDDGAVVARQLRFGLKRLDVLVEWAHGDEEPSLEAIEVKMTDWRRAAHQAYLSASYADRASIALPRLRCDSVDLEHLASLGVGLIAFDEAGWTRLLAPATRHLPPSVKAAVTQRLHGETMPHAENLRRTRYARGLAA